MDSNQTPSKLKQPKQRHEIDFDSSQDNIFMNIDSLEVLSPQGQKARIVRSPSRNLARRPALPNHLPRPSSQPKRPSSASLMKGVPKLDRPIQYPQKNIVIDNGTQGRLEEMEFLMKNLQSKVDNSNNDAHSRELFSLKERLTSLEVEKSSLMELLQNKERSFNSLQIEHNSLLSSNKEITKAKEKDFDILRSRYESDIQQLVEQKQKYVLEIDSLTLKEKETLSSRNHIDSSLAKKEAQIEELMSSLKRAKQSLQEKEEDFASTINRLKSKNEEEITDLSSKASRLQSQLELSKEEYLAVIRDISNLKTSLSSQGSTLIESQTLYRSSQEEQNILKIKISSLEGTIVSLNDCCFNFKQEIEGLEKKLLEGESHRRYLHNLVQELKGNIRVFCRLRPPTTKESLIMGGNVNEMKHITLNKDKEREEIVLTPHQDDGGVVKSFPFSFDRVFSPSNSQSDCFDEISQLVQSALDGYKVCIFAYGQTGSGKTFTMEGDNSSPELLGMIPRSVRLIFESTLLLSQKGWSFLFECSFLEIYNETLKDLLCSSSTTNASNASITTTNVNATKYDIKHLDGSTTVTNLTICPVKDVSDVEELLSKAQRNRSVGQTLCNEHSSRSHSVFTLKISGQNLVTSEKVEGILNLIDLAGSERLKESGASGDRLKETQAINKSLSSLGDVIHSLSNKEAHIPYRNSKLTYLLQNSLGGNSKTLMFVNISPVLESISETISSLRFATKVNSCQIGTARKNVK